MTLSVLIPTFNYNARALVDSMLKRAQTESVQAEVIVGDDASTSETAWMDEVESLEDVHIIHAGHNLGRARICNLMASKAAGQWLLIVDADALVPKEFSLKRYLAAGNEAPVVCGGLYHPSVNPNPADTLRYAYERKADSHRSASLRNLHPHSQLSTFNLLIRRNVFMAIQFDEHCTDYGYEDTLFGVQLQKKGVLIKHIDNPLVHMGLDSNAAFLKKTETAMHTLHALQGKMEGHSRLENTANRLHQWHLTGIIKLFYRLTRPLLRRNLLGPHPSLLIFSFYKLGYFITIQK